MLEKQEIVSSIENRFIDIMKCKRSYKGKYPLIDLGIGEDKSKPNKGIIKGLKKSLSKSSNHKYSDAGIYEFKVAALEYLKRKNISVDIDEILPIMGAKSILSILPILYVEEKDYIVTLSPSYIVFEKMAQFMKGKIHHVYINDSNADLALRNVDDKIWKKTKILNLNFPHNPTGSTINKETYEYLVKKANQYHFLIINDAAYIDISYEYVPTLMEIEGAKEVGLEIYTLSKSFNMTGYRIGFIVGDKKRIEVLTKFKDCFDSGQFIPIQYGAIYALKHESVSKELKDKYYRRLCRFNEIFSSYGFETTIPKATFYLYVKVPNDFKSAKDFAIYFLNELGIMTIPYDDYGSYIRVSVTFDGKEEKVYRELELRLKKFKNRLV